MEKSRLLKASSILWITFLITSCTQCMWISCFADTNKSQSSKSIIEKNINQKDECIEIDVSYPQVKYENLSSVNNEIKSWTNQWIGDVKNILEDYKKHGYICNMQFQLFSRFFSTLDNEKLLSFYIDYYQFTGGAHGITTRRAYTLDIKSGDKLKIKDLFKQGYNYKSVIDEEIKRQVNQDKEKYFPGKEGFTGINDDVKFYIRDGNLVIYYGQYEIAPYAAGIPEFNIPLEKFADNFIYGKMK